MERENGSRSKEEEEKEAVWSGTLIEAHECDSFVSTNKESDILGNISDVSVNGVNSDLNILGNNFISKNENTVLITKRNSSSSESGHSSGGESDDVDKKENKNVLKINVAE